jgi:hypothetical protein
VEVIDTSSQQSVASSGKQYGRNDIVVVVGPNGEEKEIKYKKAEALLEKGWSVK